ncbi:hypothetical protein BTHI11S_00012 [Bosea thiooxidans]
MGGGGATEDPIKEIAGAKLLARAVTGIEMKDLKSLADEAKARASAPASSPSSASPMTARPASSSASRPT